MKVGSFVFATDQGLGILARSFYDHGVVTDALVIHHRSRPVHMEWYPGAEYIQATNLEAMKRFVDRMDCMLFFETPFNWDIVDYCRKVGCRSVIMPMYECMPVVIPYQPDLWLCPSLLDYQCFSRPLIASGLPGMTPEMLKEKCVFIPVPVKVKWRQRTRAEVFVHNAGHGGLRGRNGTAELLEATRFVNSSVQIIIRTQEAPQGYFSGKFGRNIDFRIGTVTYEQLYDEGDVFIFPEKFNGLSLPLQEARAAGMLVMATNRFPMNTWLPTEPLIKPDCYTRERVANRFLEFDAALTDPRSIAEKIDEGYGRDITQYSLDGEAWAKSMSWEVLKPRYMEVLQPCVSHT